MNTDRENNHGEYWANEDGWVISFDIKWILNWIGSKMKFLFSVLLLFLTPLAQGQECFYPAHNMVGYSDLLTSATGWNTALSTITDDSGATTPPEALNVNKTFKLVALAGNSALITGATGNKYVVNSAGYILSIYAKYSNQQWIRFGTSGASTFACNYDIQNGATGSCVGLSNPTITAVGDGWYYLTAYYSGSTAVSNAFRFRVEITSSSSGSASTTVGGETVFLSAPQAQDNRVPNPEYKKYVATTDFYRVWGNPRRCNYEFLTRPFENRTTEQIAAGFQ